MKTRMKMLLGFSTAVALTAVLLGLRPQDDQLRADCNRNGIRDDLDISIGTSADCNRNGVPDECERLLASDGDNPADVNGDGDINVLDLIDLLLCFGQPAALACEAEDVNNDGTVNVLDLIELLLAFSCTHSASE